MRTKQIAFVPEWIDSVIKRKGLPSGDLLKIEKIAPFFSIEDLASLIALEYHSKIFTGVSTAGDSLLWSDRWCKSTKDERLLKLIADAAVLASQEVFQKETLERLFAKTQVIDSGVQKETFEISLLGDEDVKVTLRSGFALQEHVANASQLFRCAVKQLYVYEEYHQLMSRRVGETYIESLLQ